MDKDLLKEDPDNAPHSDSRGPLRLTNPKVYGGLGYNLRNNNCATYAQDTWYNLNNQSFKEYFGTGHPSTGFLFDDPKGLSDSLSTQNARDSTGSKNLVEDFFSHLLESITSF